MGLEPMISRTTIWRANQLHHTHHIYYLSNYLCPTKYRFIQFSVVLTSLGGFEPSTYGLEGRCSIQLSYEPTLNLKKMERMMRIELTPSAWKAEVLPLNYIRTKWSGRRDSNSRPSPWQGDALPLSHFRTLNILMKLVEGGGFEPPKAQLTDLQSAPFGHSGNPRYRCRIFLMRLSSCKQFA